MSFYSPDQVTSKNFSSIWMKWSEVKVAHSCPTLQPCGLYGPWNSPGQNTGVGSCSLLQGIFPTQGSNPSLLHCRRILYHLSHKGSPRILEWVDYPFSSVSSGSRNQTGVYRIARGFFTDWVIREAHQSGYSPTIKLMQKLYKVPEVRLEIQETVLEIHSTNAECLLCAVNSSLCYTSSENTLNNFNNGCHYSLKD